LDDIADPRVTELESDDEQVPQLVKEKPNKSKNKRTAEEDAEEAIDGILKKASEEQNDKRQAKKLKNNAGRAVPGAEVNGTGNHTKESKTTESKTEEPKAGKKGKTDGKKEDNTPQSNGKKVQFAEKLEQGPTPSKNAPAPTKGPRNVNGVSVDDKKVGTGQTAKKGDRVGMRYIGKLKDGKVFDCEYSFLLPP
jgi:FK506-binding nuclear protein